MNELQSTIMNILDKNSGGVKLTHLIVEVIATYGDKGKKIGLENINKEIGRLIKLGKIKSIEYTWENKIKQFIYLK